MASELSICELGTLHGNEFTLCAYICQTWPHYCFHAVLNAESMQWTHRMYVTCCWQVGQSVSLRQCLWAWQMLESPYGTHNQKVVKKHRSMRTHVHKLQESCPVTKCVKSLSQHSKCLVAMVTQFTLQLRVVSHLKEYTLAHADSTCRSSYSGSCQSWFKFWLHTPMSQSRERETALTGMYSVRPIWTFLCTINTWCLSNCIRGFCFAETMQCISDAQFRWSLVIDQIKSPKTHCSNPHQNFGPIKYSSGGLVSHCFSHAAKQPDFCFPMKFKP